MRRRGKLNEEVFHALANPSEVHLYNWAEYALEELRRCAARVRQQVADGAPRIVLTGCLLFLQVYSNFFFFSFVVLPPTPISPHEIYMFGIT